MSKKINFIEFEEADKIIRNAADEIESYGIEAFNKFWNDNIESEYLVFKNIYRISINLFNNIDKKDELNNFDPFIEKKKYLIDLKTIFNQSQFSKAKNFQLLTDLLDKIKVVSNNYKSSFFIKQQKDRFKIEKENKLYIKGAKKLKSGLNLFYKNWKQKIQLKNIIEFYASAKLSGEVISLLNKSWRLRILTLHTLDKLQNDALSVANFETENKNADSIKNEIERYVNEFEEYYKNKKAEILNEFSLKTNKLKEEFLYNAYRLGTAESPNANYTSRKSDKIVSSSNKKWNRLLKKWNKYEGCLTEEVYSAIELEMLGWQMNDYARKLEEDIQKIIKEDIQKALLKSIDDVDKFYTLIKDDLKTKSLRLSQIKSYHSELKEELIKHKISLFRKGSPWDNIKQRLNSFNENFALLTKNVKSEREVCGKELRNIPEVPEKLTSKKINLKEFVDIYVALKIPDDVKKIIREYENEFTSIFNSFDTISRAIDFNFSTAINDLESENENEDNSSRDLITGVLERSTKQLNGLIEASKELEEKIIIEIKNEVDEYVERIIEIVDKKEFTKIRTKLVEKDLRKKYRHAYGTAKKFYSITLPKVRSTSFKLLRNVKTVNRWSKEKLGLKTIEKTASISSLDETVLDQKYKAKLPLIYQKLFSFEPLVTEEFFIGREQELNVFKNAITRWKNGQISSVAVYGELGSGKTTLINLAQKKLFSDLNTKRYTFDTTITDKNELLKIIAELLEVEKTKTFDELVSLINREVRGSVIIENIHQLFFKTIGGFDLFQDFLLFLSLTGKSIFWIVTMEGYTWNYLNDVMNIEDNFIFSINSTNMNEKQIEKVILSRHQVSGYDISFEIDEKLKKSKQFKKLLNERTRREAARSYYFKELGEIADGNIFIAIFYWIRSIKSFDEQTLVFNMPVEIDVSYLEKLNTLKLHTLAGIIIHGGLSEEKHSEIFLVTREQSSLILASLLKTNLIFLSERGEYKVNKVLYRSFGKALKAKNIL